MTGAIAALIGLLLGLAALRAASDRRRVLLDTAFLAAHARAGGGPPLIGFVISARPPFAETVARLRELLDDPTPAPEFTRRSQPVVVIDSHVITLFNGTSAFLSIPTHEIRGLDVALVPVKSGGSTTRKVWAVTLTVVRGGTEVVLPLAPLTVFGGFSKSTDVGSFARDLHARVWPAPTETVTASTALQGDAGEGAQPTGGGEGESPGALPSSPRGLGAWAPVLAVLVAAPVVWLVPIAIGNTRFIGHRGPNGDIVSAGPALIWWACILLLLVGASVLVAGFVRRIRWARSQQ